MKNAGGFGGRQCGVLRRAQDERCFRVRRASSPPFALSPSKGQRSCRSGGTRNRCAVLTERIENRILLVRGQRVMLSTDLAALYGVEPRALVQAVKRNSARFPEDFMFQLDEDEFADLKSQIVTSSWGGMRRARPYAFTEQGVAMLSSVLRSTHARRPRERGDPFFICTLSQQGQDGSPRPRG